MEVARGAARGPQQAPSVVWRVPTGGSIHGTASELDDGSIVFGSADGMLRRVNHAGAIIYSTNTGAPLHTRALALPSQETVVGNEAGAILRIDAAGNIVWRLQAHGPIAADPVSDSDDRDLVYFAGDGIYAIDVRGFVRWHHVEASTVYSTPLITPDGQIVFGTLDGRAVALDMQGRQRWSTRINAAVLTPIERLSDGSIALHANKRAFTLSRDGNIVTADNAPSDSAASTSNSAVTDESAARDTDESEAAAHITYDAAGARYFVVDHMLYGSSGDGTMLWSYNLGSRVTAQVMLSSSGTLIVGAEDGILYALH